MCPLLCHKRAQVLSARTDEHTYSGTFQHLCVLFDQLFSVCAALCAHSATHVLIQQAESTHTDSVAQKSSFHLFLPLFFAHTIVCAFFRSTQFCVTLTNCTMKAQLRPWLKLPLLVLFGYQDQKWDRKRANFPSTYTGNSATLLEANKIKRLTERTFH